ncbi:MAG: hypothetical protein JWO98_1043 [Frankiales bacterium]|nr:hypothetical protein [Frankiales bacterium]
MTWRSKNKRASVEGRLLDGEGGWSFRHPADPDLSPRMHAEMARNAVHKAVTEMHRTGALDAGNGDVLDPWLDSLRPQWIAHHVASSADREAAAKLAAGEYEAKATAARQRADAAKAERASTQRLVDIFEQRLIEPNEHAALGHPDRRRRPRPALDALDGLTPERGWKVLSRLLLLLAAAGDLASFYITVAGMMDQSFWVLAVLTLAVTAAAIGVMHLVGRATRNLREGEGGLGRPAIWLMTAGWLALGAAAFYVRLQGDQHAAANGGAAFGGGSGNVVGGKEALLQALLLGALFLGSGALAFYIGFSDHHPRMKPYLTLRARLQRAQEDVARTEQAAIEAERLRDNAQDEVRRAATRTAAAEASVDAEIAELKELARIHIAGLLGDPPATNNLTTGRTPEAAARSMAPGDLAIPSPATPLDVSPSSLNGNGYPAGAH